MARRTTTHPSRLGLTLAALYFALLALTWSITAAASRPEHMGFEWIPFALLIQPWPPSGILLNPLLLYTFGHLLSRLRSRLAFYG